MGHAVLPSLVKNMRHPSKYALVVESIFAITVVAYVAIAAVGYVAFGPNTLGNITENLLQNSKLIVLVLISTLITVSAKFTLAAYPLIEG